MKYWLKDKLYKLSSVRKNTAETYFDVLDGWRGLSILFVLATHLLPLGAKTWRLNETTGLIGMALFFTLSGFLIANFLIHRPNVWHFLIRRLFRIIPLSWLYLLVALPFLNIDLNQYLAHFLFYGNWPPMSFSEGTSHFWSLCVEMQFYGVVAILFFLLREKGLYLIIPLCLAVTANRINSHVYISIATYYRMDEILVGVIMALIYNKKLGAHIPKFFAWINPYSVMIFFIISCHPDSGFMNYFRPYLAATLVASTLYNPPQHLANILNLKILVYLATVSYALYVIHPVLIHTWLGEGDLLIKYAKRPLLFAVLFLLAHLSTVYYEKYWITLAKKLTK